MPTPASTVVVVRQGREDIEVLLLLRSAALKFNGDCWVFPGGRIDPEDYPDQQRLQEYRAAQRAAVRETQEEAGLDISGEALLHFAHWTTPEGMSRRFSTWFFLCVVATPAANTNCQSRLCRRCEVSRRIEICRASLRAWQPFLSMCSPQTHLSIDSKRLRAEERLVAALRSKLVR